MGFLKNFQARKTPTPQMEQVNAAGWVQNPQADRRNRAPEKVIDQRTIDKGLALIESPVIGLPCFPFLLYEVQKEFSRALRHRRNLSIVVFDLQLKHQDRNGDVRLVPLPESAALEALYRIKAQKRSFDFLGHYETDLFSLLLPDADPNGTARLVARMIESLFATPLPYDIDRNKLHFAFGIAGCPDDGTSVGRLLGAAEYALAEALQRGVPLVKYHDITNQRQSCRQAV